MKKFGIGLIALCGVLLLGVLVKDATAQTASDTPFGFAQLFANPSIGYGTHPAKPIFSSQTNIMGKPTYAFSVNGTPAANAMCEIEAGPSLRVRLRRICMHPGQAATGAAATLALIRTSTAGAGTALTAAQIANLDGQDANFSGIIRAAGTSGTAGATIYSHLTAILTTNTTTLQIQPFCLNYDDGLFKSPILSPGATNGFAVTESAAGTTPVASSTVCAGVITEEAY